MPRTEPKGELGKNILPEAKMIEDSFDIDAVDTRTPQVPVPRAAYSDCTAAVMARLSELAYDPSFDAPVSNPPPELAQLGFHAVEIFADEQTKGLAFLARSATMIVLCFRRTKYPENFATG